MELDKLFKDEQSRQQIIAHFQRIQMLCGDEKHQAVEIFEDSPCYEEEDLISLYRVQNAILWETDPCRQETLANSFRQKVSQMKPKTDKPERIYLWPAGKMPKHTPYTENPGHQYNHDPGFLPYMYEMLLSPNIQPKGAVVVCAGGDHGDSTLFEGYFVCKELNQIGYQCFLLNNRVHNRPWSKQECGADTARAIQIIRSRAQQYAIAPDRIAFAGFSNGGLTGDANIRYYSGGQKVRDSFPEYIPDALDEFCGSPNAFLCIYGPRMKDDTQDDPRAVYPPTFFAVGRKDEAAQANLQFHYRKLLDAGVPVEIHTFSGIPHGIAGRTHIDGAQMYQNFQLWLPLADHFMQDAFNEGHL